MLLDMWLGSQELLLQAAGSTTGMVFRKGVLSFTASSQQAHTGADRGPACLAL